MPWWYTVGGPRQICLSDWCSIDEGGCADHLRWLFLMLMELVASLTCDLAYRRGSSRVFASHLECSPEMLKYHHLDSASLYGEA